MIGAQPPPVPGALPRTPCGPTATLYMVVHRGAEHHPWYRAAESRTQRRNAW